MKEDDLIGYCWVCGRPIYFGEKHYRMPDSVLVCDDPVCVEEWLKDYARYT